MGNDAPQGDGLLTTAQVAEMTGWSITTINRWALAGDIPTAGKLPGRTGAWLFERATVEDLRRREQVSA